MLTKNSIFIPRYAAIFTWISTLNFLVLFLISVYLFRYVLTNLKILFAFHCVDKILLKDSKKSLDILSHLNFARTLARTHTCTRTHYQ